MANRGRDWFRQAEYDLQKATILDKFYIPTRYPNGLPDGIPHDSYTKDEALSALRATKAIIEWCRSFFPAGPADRRTPDSESAEIGD